MPLGHYGPSKCDACPRGHQIIDPGFILNPRRTLFCLSSSQCSILWIPIPRVEFNKTWILLIPAASIFLNRTNDLIQLIINAFSGFDLIQKAGRVNSASFFPAVLLKNHIFTPSASLSFSTICRCQKLAILGATIDIVL